jgi:spore maturation protein CgeB
MSQASTAAKNYLKRHRLPNLINVRIKSWQVKGHYEQLCRHYGTPSVLQEPETIRELSRSLFEAHRSLQQRPASAAPVRVLYVGTDWDQDNSGLLQGLRRVAEVTLLEQVPGSYGQRWPRSPEEYEAVREHNGRVLLEKIRNLSEAGTPPQIIIGQMCGKSMHWRALAAAREQGLAVVNIFMDDRHALKGERLSDGTWSGTQGLAPFLSLACTDAPECVPWYTAEGCRALYLPEASAPDVFRPRAGPKLYEVSFVGANYGIRTEMVQALEQAGTPVQVYGQGWPRGRIPGPEMTRLFAQSKIILGCGTILHCRDFMALKLRDFDGPMSGSLYLTHEVPELIPLFQPGREMVTFRNLPELVDRVQYYLGRDEEREALAAAGRRRAFKDHTWEQRFAVILNSLEHSY